ncbi:MAG: nitrous oxide reductase family maturation protein NosD [Candidatus Thorarchaeota archaeon]
MDSVISEVVEHDFIEISSNEDFSAQEYPGNGTLEDPYIIENFQIQSYNSCITIENTSYFFLIRYCILTVIRTDELLYSGVSLRNVTNAKIENCTINGNGPSISIFESGDIEIKYTTLQSRNSGGIDLRYSCNCTFESNFVIDCDGTGLLVEYSSYLDVLDNIVGNNKEGIYLFNCSYGTLRNNMISSNSQSGVVLDDSYYILVNQNNIIGNSGDGLKVHSFYCHLIDNTIRENNGFGIDMESTYDTVFGNLIGWNTGGNARDRGNNNTWDDSVNKGNYWSDYIGFGSYEILGSANSVDRYPQVFPGAVSVLTIVVVSITIIVTLVGIGIFYFRKVRT